MTLGREGARHGDGRGSVGCGLRFVPLALGFA
jgi:hypothetical protein